MAATSIPILGFFWALLLLLAIPLVLVIPIWAIVDAARRPRAAFVASGHSKTPWIVALAVCLLILPFVNVVIAIVYLAAISPAVRRAQRALPPTSAPPSPPRWTAYPPPPPPPGWYPDPSDPTVEWYWDGSAYTNGRDNPAHSPDPGGD